MEPDVSRLLVGPVLEPIRKDPSFFAKVRVEGGTVVWNQTAQIFARMF